MKSYRANFPTRQSLCEITNLILQFNHRTLYLYHFFAQIFAVTSQKNPFLWYHNIQLVCLVSFYKHLVIVIINLTTIMSIFFLLPNKMLFMTTSDESFEHEYIIGTLSIIFTRQPKIELIVSLRFCYKYL